MYCVALLQLYNSYFLASFSLSVMKATVKSQVTDSMGRTLTTVHVDDVLKQSHVKISKGTSAQLWTYSECVCPKLTPGVSQIIMGYENPLNDRLLFMEGCIAAKWKKSWPNSIKVKQITSISLNSLDFQGDNVAEKF